MSEILLPRFDGETEQADSCGLGTLATARGNLPMCALGYQTVIRSLAVRTEITQTFYNPFDKPIEATYVFPVEGTMAVTDCLMMVGDRIIRADLQERGEARRRYQQAIRRGHRAALLEENRSETFSLSVGNIPAGEAIRIRLVTVGQLAVVNSVWTLRLPLVVAPRYTSGFELPGISLGSGTVGDTDEVPDASHITPAVLLPGYRNPVELSLSVDIDLESLKPNADWAGHMSSSLHSVVVNGDRDRALVRIRPGNRVDRDFILRGSVASDRLTTSARLEPPTEKQRGTFAIDLMPPQIANNSKRGRDVVFVLDRSGSMRGWKYVAAQRGVARLIDTLGERDRFGVIVFDDQQLVFSNDLAPQKRNSPRELAQSVTGLFAATDKNRFAAINWLNNIAVNGGTEMAPAIELALDMAGLESSADSKASIVLITDGQITGEDFVLSRLNGIASERRPRIYTLGVDRAVNASVLRRLSTATGGTFELVESESQLDKSLRVLAQDLGTPVLTGIQVDAEEECNPVFGSEDLYANRPVSIFGRTNRSDLTVRLTARDSNGEPWASDIRIQSNGTPSAGTLLSLWGKGRVRLLEDQYAINNIDDAAARQTIVDTSLESHVLSRFTAYVAVDESEIVNQSGTAERIAQPVELPEGWQLGAMPSIPAELRMSFNRPGAQSSSESSFSNWPEAQIELLGKKLVKQGTMSAEQWADAQTQSAGTPRNAIEHATLAGYILDTEAVVTAAKIANKPVVDLEQAWISEEVIELVPESVARENSILPIGEDGSLLVVATSNPWNSDTADKLRFILNRNVSFVVSSKGSLQNAINRLYGQVEGESADSMLQEFTDTAIDFTETADNDCVFHDTSPNFSMKLDCMGLAPEAMRPISSGMTRSRKSRAAPVTGGAREGELSPVTRLIKLIFFEVAKLRVAKVILQKTAGSIRVQYLIDGVLHDRDSLPLRQWNLIFEQLKAFSLNHVQNGDLWEGEIDWSELQKTTPELARPDGAAPVIFRNRNDEEIEIVFGEFAKT